MKKIPLIIITVLFSAYTSAQVGINTTTPSASSVLDIEASDKGLLIPRVALTGPIDTATIVNGNVESLIIYNTNQTANLDKGFCFWDGAKWSNLQDSNDIKPVTNELIFDGDDDVDPNNDNYYYVSINVDAKWKVVRYNKLDVNDEAIANTVNNGSQSSQPLTLAVCKGLNY